MIYLIVCALFFVLEIGLLTDDTGVERFFLIWMSELGGLGSVEKTLIFRINRVFLNISAHLFPLAAPLKNLYNLRDWVWPRS